MKNLEVNDLANLGKKTIGLEFENPLLKRDGNAIDFPTIQSVWRSFEKKGWKPRFDPTLSDVIDAVSKDFGVGSASIISDAGAGNFELALSPQANLDSAKAAYDKVMKEVLQVIKASNLILVGLAMQPGNIPDMEQFRRRNSMYIAWSEMGVSDIFANETSSAISAHQVGIGMKLSEFVEATNELMKISGLIIALCGNSAIQNWKVLPYKEWRAISIGTIRFINNIPEVEKLVGFPERPFTSVADFFKYYWEVPFMMLPLLRDRTGWIVLNDRVDYLKFFHGAPVNGRILKGGEKVTVTAEVEDINWATIQMWPHVKPHFTIDTTKVKLEDFVTNFDNDTLETYLADKLTNCYIECRAAGASPVGEEMVIPALMLGIMNNLEGLKEITKLYNWKEWGDLVFEVSVHGIDSKIKGKSIIPLLNDLLSVALSGLSKRKLGEEKYLEPIKMRIKEKKNPADKCIEEFKKSGPEGLLNFSAYKS
jgi:gamma-glutamylcysteine synthetase